MLCSRFCYLCGSNGCLISMLMLCVISVLVSVGFCLLCVVLLIVM